jgi:hypothetical protein
MARNANAIEQERGRDVFKATQDGVWGREREGSLVLRRIA